MLIIQIITVDVGCATCTEKLTEIQKVINQFMDLKQMKQLPLRNVQLVTIYNLRLSSFIVPKDIVSILVDQNFTMNAIGMVLESKRFVWKIMIYEAEFVASFATRHFSTLTTIFGHLDDVGSHKNTRYE